ncbi:alpha/beta hydrolase [Salinicola aestuarinus]|uniref:alpha/beta hydrolase n=1 Tax=Salinicola aestuarinus TaxID=1949082 RepID=UPI00130054E0|nr:alpha/beta hydrolase [Salinicola aestuarinus]
MKTVLDITYITIDDVALKADLYLPERDDKPPVILFLHGGGWKFGDRKLAPDLSRFFAREGFAMISVDYRLSDQAPFPAAIEDVKTAIRWVKSVADTYGFDAERLGLWGSSAGAHLATLAVTAGPARFPGHDYGEFDEQVRAVVDGYGPTDFLQQDAFRDPDGVPSDDPESIQMPAGKFSADADSMESLFIGVPIEDAPAQVAAANPITYLESGLPPMLILHGLSDTAVPWQQSRLLFEALSRSDNPAILGLIEGLGHGFFNRNALDDDGPRTWHVSQSDAPERSSVECHEVFAYVGRFFANHLRHP